MDPRLKDMMDWATDQPLWAAVAAAGFLFAAWKAARGILKLVFVLLACTALAVLLMRFLS